MKNSTVRVLSGLLLAGLAVVTGCSTVESRKVERADSFSKLSQSEQQTVMKGRISNGMSEDAVYIALGQPLRKISGQMNGNTTVTWVYGRLESYCAPTFYYAGVNSYNGEQRLIREYRPVTEYRVRDSFLVYFVQGKVTGWQEL